MTGRDIFSERVVFTVGPIPFTATMITSVAVSSTLIALAYGVARAMSRRMGTESGTIGVIAIEWLDRLVTDIVGVPVPWLTTFVGSLFFFIAGGNLAGQLPHVKTPAASLATTSALAIVVFFVVPIAGIHSKGIRGYLRHYLAPNPLLLPLHLLSELSRTFALAVRLFGNMMSGHLIVALLVALIGLFVPVPLMALDLLIGVLQAYIFAILATVYIGAAIRTGEE